MFPEPAAEFLQPILGAEYGGNNNLCIQTRGIQRQDETNVAHNILSNYADISPPVRFPPPPNPQPMNFFANG